MVRVKPMNKLNDVKKSELTPAEEFRLSELRFCLFLGGFILYELLVLLMHVVFILLNGSITATVWGAITVLIIFWIAMRIEEFLHG